MGGNDVGVANTSSNLPVTASNVVSLANVIEESFVWVSMLKKHIIGLATTKFWIYAIGKLPKIKLVLLCRVILFSLNMKFA